MPFAPKAALFAGWPALSGRMNTANVLVAASTLPPADTPWALPGGLRAGGQPSAYRPSLTLLAHDVCYHTKGKMPLALKQLDHLLEVAART